jgi:hypothetical protein
MANTELRLLRQNLDNDKTVSPSTLCNLPTTNLGVVWNVQLIWSDYPGRSRGRNFGIRHEREWQRLGETRDSNIDRHVSLRSPQSMGANLP